ncbi:MAG: hypothetical protein AB7H88_07145 [Vicinamibacterales bacterium]
MNETDAQGYCREVEAHLCRRNEGHLIRIVGPAFEQVLGWQRDGIPLKVVLAGVDRYIERRNRKGPQRRPVRIEFCDADVRDAFDDWRRAVGVSVPAAGAGEAGGGDADAGGGASRRGSLAAHIERVVARLTLLRGSEGAGGAVGEALKRAARAADALAAGARGARGEARERLVASLAAIDEALLAAAAASLPPGERTALEAEAERELAPFRARLPADAYQQARAAAVHRLLRERFGLPKVGFD